MDSRSSATTQQRPSFSTTLHCFEIWLPPNLTESVEDTKELDAHSASVGSPSMGDQSVHQQPDYIERLKSRILRALMVPPLGMGDVEEWKSGKRETEVPSASDHEVISPETWKTIYEMIRLTHEFPTHLEKQWFGLIPGVKPEGWQPREGIFYESKELHIILRSDDDHDLSDLGKVELSALRTVTVYIVWDSEGGSQNTWEPALDLVRRFLGCLRALLPLACTIGFLDINEAKAYEKKNLSISDIIPAELRLRYLCLAYGMCQVDIKQYSTLMDSRPELDQITLLLDQESRIDDTLQAGGLDVPTPFSGKSYIIISHASGNQYTLVIGEGDRQPHGVSDSRTSSMDKCLDGGADINRGVGDDTM